MTTTGPGRPAYRKHTRPQTGIRLDPQLKAQAVEKAGSPTGPGTLQAAVEQLLAGWVAGTIVIPPSTP